MEQNFVQLDIFSFLEDFNGKEAVEDRQDGLLSPIEKVDRECLNYYHSAADFICTKTEKISKNIEAIKTLKKIENREATKEEQKILSQYLGWGGFQEVFETQNKYYHILKNLLSEKEYEEARASVLSAFYTPDKIIEQIYKVLQSMGFQRGNILEPAMGIGKFFSLLPVQLQDSKLFGVEIDTISGKIAKKLFPKADISISGFEDTEFEENYFDLIIGNIPFGDFSIYDKKYGSQRIHDYFFSKASDLVRPGGLLTFITAKGTMDKKNSKIREHLNSKFVLLGAVRLPQGTFSDTKAEADILFLQKRTVPDIKADVWIESVEYKDGLLLNQYFKEHPEMIYGSICIESGPYGNRLVCKEDQGKSLDYILNMIQGKYIPEIVVNNEKVDTEVIPAIPGVPNFSFYDVNGTLYYKENSSMQRIDIGGTKRKRILGLMKIRDCVQELIQYQLEQLDDPIFLRKRLNHLYDQFTKKFGIINSLGNKIAFDADASYYLLCSLEDIGDDGKIKAKADIFYRRTIGNYEKLSHVDSASEAYILSFAECGKIDFEFMQQITGKERKTLLKELRGLIYKNPETKKYEDEKEYLSGDVRRKLEIAKWAAAHESNYELNVKALEEVQPTPISPEEIEIQVGATWIDPDIYTQFMNHLFKDPENQVSKVEFTNATGRWYITDKSHFTGNVLNTNTYGTQRILGIHILERTLNLKDIKIYDSYIDDEGKERKRLNEKETMIAVQKQDEIKEAFKEWVFLDYNRRNSLSQLYNQKFNCFRNREYDGSFLKFPGMSNGIKLRDYQKNAVARILFGGNTLLAESVGMGKTYQICAAAMELRRLHIVKKNMIVVPNHLVGQWGTEFYKLYPGAKLLIASEKDFTPARRQKFCSRIATGDYDAVIIAASHFEKIPLSRDRQMKSLEAQISEIMLEIDQLQAMENGPYFTIKQLESTKKKIELNLKRLSESPKDKAITFEQLGIDKLFVDEAHYYKNLFLYTKMNNVAGIPQTNAKKSYDLFTKCRYLDEKTGNKGVCFATGTPISNSMVELYTMQRYLQYDLLKERGMVHFDSWASIFGETVNSIELAPEGGRYRTKTRFARFMNIAELMRLFKECAFFKIGKFGPKPIYKTEVIPPSQVQKNFMNQLGKRAEKIHSGTVKSDEDNMLKVTNDGRKLALDQRLINFEAGESLDSKTLRCVENAVRIYKKYPESAQLIFCDLSTPTGSRERFNIYDDIKLKLVNRGVPVEEIAFIHNAKTTQQKNKLFRQVKHSKVRFLLGSTQKMGTGMNVQKHLKALHHIDVPWRPSDLEQREGRIIRHGNLYQEVLIFRYVTEGTFDAYSWQLIENKQRFISQIITEKEIFLRSCDDFDERELNFAEVKALATGNPEIKEKMDLDIKLKKLKILKSNFQRQQFAMEEFIHEAPKKIQKLNTYLSNSKKDRQIYNQYSNTNHYIINELPYNKASEAAEVILNYAQYNTKELSIGQYNGFDIVLAEKRYFDDYRMILRGNNDYVIDFHLSVQSIYTCIVNAFKSIPKQMEKYQKRLRDIERETLNAESEVKDKVFPYQEELELTMKRLSEVNIKLSDESA